MTGFRRSLARTLRTMLVAIFAVLLFMRVGPLCESVASAAAPAASTMADCDHAAAPVEPGSARKVAASMCGVNCIAVETAALDQCGGGHVPTMSAWPLAPLTLTGFASGPSPPPPREM